MIIIMISKRLNKQNTCLLLFNKYTTMNWVATVSNVSDMLAFPVYSKTGFLALQRNIDTAIMILLRPDVNTTSVKVQLQRFPYPLSDTFAAQLRASLPLVLLLSFLCSVIDITKDVVHEKESQLKVGHRSFQRYSN